MQNIVHHTQTGGNQHEQNQALPFLCFNKEKFTKKQGFFIKNENCFEIKDH